MHLNLVYVAPKLFKGLDKGFDFLKENVKIFGENVEDLAIGLNDDIGNLTVEI